MVTAATLLDTQKGPIIGVFHEYAHLGKGKSIHAAGQMEWFNCKVDDRSQHVGDTQSIQTSEGYVIPLSIEYGLVYMQSMRIPTNHDLQHYPHVLFTSPDIWHTSVLDHGIPPSLPETHTSPTLRLVPPQGEDQPPDLTSDVVVYGRPNLDESDNTPPPPPPCPSSTLMTSWGAPSSNPWRRMGRERRLLFLSMSRISINHSFHLTNSPKITTMEVPTTSLLSGRLGSKHGKPRITTSRRKLLLMTRNTSPLSRLDLE